MQTDDDGRYHPQHYSFVFKTGAMLFGYRRMLKCQITQVPLVYLVY